MGVRVMEMRLFGQAYVSTDMKQAVSLRRPQCTLVAPSKLEYRSVRSRFLVEVKQLRGL